MHALQQARTLTGGTSTQRSILTLRLSDSAVYTSSVINAFWSRLRVSALIFEV